MDRVDTLNVFKKHYDDETYMELNPSARPVTLLLIKHLSATKDISIQKIIMKALIKPALCMNYVYVEQFLREFGSEIGAECLRIHGWLNNSKFIKAFGVHLPNNLQIRECFEMTAAKYSNDSRYFELAISNYIAAYDNSERATNASSAFKIILSNLENSHIGVHKQLLELFKRLIICYDEESQHDVIMLNTILELPWTNRNKYFLLTQIVIINIDLLLNHKNFNLTSLLKGIQTGLSIHHLMAPSQTFVKAIYAREPFRSKFMKMVAELLWTAEVQVAKNLIKYWFTSFDQKFIEQLYQVMNADDKTSCIATTSPQFYRLLLLRNVFKRTFNDPQLDARIREFSCHIDDPAIKIEIFHILIEGVLSESNEVQQLQNILTLLQFLRHNMLTEDSSFADHHVMKRLPEFFNLLASRKLRNLQLQQEIFTIIRNDIYEHGVVFGSYESVVFSLKFLRVILKQYCGGVGGDRFSKNTNIEGNINFKKFLQANKIWDLTSEQIFLQLLKLVNECQNSDLSELALEILVKYFVNSSLVENVLMDNGATFNDWVSKRIYDLFNDPEISTAYSAKRYFALKFEMSINKGLGVHEMLCTIDELKKRFLKLQKSGDPVHAMTQGLHLFNVMDSINIGVRRLDPQISMQKIIPVLQVLLKIITYHFMDLINDPAVTTSFEVLDQKLIALIAKSSVPASDDLKPKLLLFIWYTLRAASEMSQALAEVVSATLSPNDKALAVCVDVNLQIATRCCHKGAIEASSDAIGKITRIVSKKFASLCNKSSAQGLHAVLVTLKKEIDCGKRSCIITGDLRCERGLLLMAHKIIANHPPFLRFLMQDLLVISTDINLIKFSENIKPIQLHLISFLIKDGELVEEMLKYYDSILLATFKAYKNSSDFVMLNALLQVIGVIVPKISNQKSHFDEHSDGIHRYEPRAVSVEEFFDKFTHAFSMGFNDLQHNMSSLPTPYIIILLEIFSKFELRNSSGQMLKKAEGLRVIFYDLMAHRCEKVRLLAALTFAHWHEVEDDMFEEIRSNLHNLFYSDGNRVHATAFYLRTMIERYASSTRSITEFDYEQFKASLRDQILEHKFIGVHNFYIRMHLLDFLMFLGFTFNSKVIKSLVVKTGLQSLFGFNVWKEKISMLEKRQ